MFNRRNHTMKINSVFNKTLLFVGAIVCTIGLQSCLDDDDNNAYYLRYPNALVTVKGAANQCKNFSFRRQRSQSLGELQ